MLIWYSTARLLLALALASAAGTSQLSGAPVVLHPIAKPEVPPDRLFSFDKTLYPGEFLLHYHIPKTGGTAFHLLFDNTNCGYRAHGVRNAYGVAARFDRNREECGFFSQEFLSFGNLSEHLTAQPQPARLLVLFRTPMSHVLSAVGHMARKRVKECRGIQRALSPECTFYKLDNLQTAHIGDKDLETALTRLNNLFWIGITEHYDASICLLSYQLGQFDSTRCNCSGTLVKPGNRGASLKHRLPDLRDVYKRTYQDTVLYQRAYELFLLRIHTAESDVGSPILCKNRDGEDALELRDYLASRRNPGSV